MSDSDGSLQAGLDPEDIRFRVFTLVLRLPASVRHTASINDIPVVVSLLTNGTRVGQSRLPRMCNLQVQAGTLIPVSLLH